MATNKKEIEEKVRTDYNINYAKIKRIISPKETLNNPEHIMVITIAFLKALDDNKIKLKDL